MSKATLSLNLDTTAAKNQARAFVAEFNKEVIKLKVETDTKSAINEFNTLRDQAKLLRNEIENAKLTTKVDTSQISKYVTELDHLNLKINLAKNSEVSVKGKANFEALESTLNRTKNQVQNLNNEKINIGAYLKGSFQSDISNIKQGIASVPRALTIGVAVAGVQAVLGALSAIANAAGSATSSIFELAGQTEQNLAGLQAVQTSYISKQAEIITSASQERLTVEQLAEARGISTNALTEEIEVKGGSGGGGATGASKAYQSEIRSEKAILSDLNFEKKNQERQTKAVVVEYKNQIRGIEDLNTALKLEENQRLANVNATDKELNALEKVLNTKQKELALEEKKLDKDKSNKEKEFDKANKTKLNDIEKQQFGLEKQLNTLTKQKNQLDDNSTANASQLDAIKSQEQSVREQITALQEQKTEISNNRKELEFNIETQQEGLRVEIESKKDLLDKDRDVFDAKKQQNQSIKDDFVAQIESNNTLIDELKNKIESANIKLDINIEPIQSKIEEVQDRINNLQELAGESQASSGGSSGGGGGTIKVASAKAKELQDLANKANSGDFSNLGLEKGLEQGVKNIIGQGLSPENQKGQIEKLIRDFGQRKTTDFYESAVKLDTETSLKRNDIIQFAKDSSVIGLSKTTEEFERLTKVAANFVAYDPSKNLNDVSQSLRQLSQGDFVSIRERFGITPQAFEEAARKSGALEGKKSLKDSTSQSEFIGQFESLDTIKTLEQLTKSRGIDKLDSENVKTFPVAVDNLVTQLQDAGLSLLGFGKQTDAAGNAFYGFSKDGLFESAKGALLRFTAYLKSEEGIKFKAELETAGNKIAKFVEGLSSKGGIESLIVGTEAFFNGLGDFVKVLPDLIGFIQATIKKFAATAGYETIEDKKSRLSTFDKKNVNFLGVETPSNKGLAEKDIKDFENKYYKKDGKYFDKENNEELARNFLLDPAKEYEKSLQDLNDFQNQKLEQIKQGLIKERQELTKHIQIVGIETKTLVQDSANGFLTFTNGVKINLSELGLEAGATAEQITAKYNEVGKGLVSSFNTGRVLSEAEITLLSQYSGLKVEEIKAQQAQIKQAMVDAFVGGKTRSIEELNQLAKDTNTPIEELKKQFPSIEGAISQPVVQGAKTATESLQTIEKGADNVVKSVTSINGVQLTDLQQQFLDLVTNLNPVSFILKNIGESLGFIKREKIELNNIGPLKEGIGGFDANGQFIAKKATGGRVTGGSGIRDDLPHLLMGGEGVLNKYAMSKLDSIDPNLFERLNQDPTTALNNAVRSVQSSTANYYQNQISNRTGNTNSFVQNNSYSGQNPVSAINEATIKAAQVIKQTFNTVT
jgi:hypothetical protein